MNNCNRAACASVSIGKVKFRPVHRREGQPLVRRLQICISVRLRQQWLKPDVERAPEASLTVGYKPLTQFYLLSNHPKYECRQRNAAKMTPHAVSYSLTSLRAHDISVWVHFPGQEGENRQQKPCKTSPIHTGSISWLLPLNILVASPTFVFTLIKCFTRLV